MSSSDVDLGASGDCWVFGPCSVEVGEFVGEDDEVGFESAGALSARRWKLSLAAVSTTRRSVGRERMKRVFMMGGREEGRE